MGKRLDQIKEALGLKLPLEPKIEPGNEWYNKLPKSVDAKGVVWYWFTKTSNPNEGQWIPEPIAKIWYYESQMNILQGKLGVVDAKIKLYTDEINRIDAYLASKEHSKTQEGIADASLRKRIQALEDYKVKLKGEGCTERDISYRKTQYQINQLTKQLSPKTPATEDNNHIANWPLEPGQAPVPGQDLYIIRGAHRAKIKNIEKNEKDPIEDALSANQAYRDYWKGVDEEINNPKE